MKPLLKALALGIVVTSALIINAREKDKNKDVKTPKQDNKPKDFKLEVAAKDVHLVDCIGLIVDNDVSDDRKLLSLWGVLNDYSIIGGNDYDKLVACSRVIEYIHSGRCFSTTPDTRLESMVVELRRNIDEFIDNKSDFSIAKILADAE